MLTTDRVAGGALVALGAFVVWESLVSARRLPLGTLRHPGPAYAPVVLALLLVGFGAVIVALGRRAPRLGVAAFPEWRHAGGILAAGTFAALGLERLGYRLTMMAVVLFLLVVLERKRWLFSLLFAVAMAFGSFLVFDTLLRVPLPRGPVLGL